MRGKYLRMKIEKIREALHAQPFRPFSIHVADGGRLVVPHQDFVAVEPAGREIIVYRANNSHQIVDVLLITRLEMKAKNGTHHKKKAA
jgi:hypothetical protein